MASVSKSSNNVSNAWTPDSSLSSTTNDIEAEPEIKIASSDSDSTFDSVRASLENKDISTDKLEPSDISREGDELFIGNEKASEFDGKIFYRPNTWFSDLNEEKKEKKMHEMALLEKEHNVEFFGGAQSALLSRDTKTTKRVYESRGIDTVDDYSLEEAEELLEEGEELIAKPRSGTCQGESIELLESAEDLEGYVNSKVGSKDDQEVHEKVLFEEYLPTGENESNHDMRMIVVGDKIYRKERVDGDGIANNIDNNGDYKDAPTMNMEELELASKTQEIFGEGFYAVDYIRTEDGDVKVMENNATPGTKIEEELDEDLKEEVADSIYQTESKITNREQVYGSRAAVM